MCNLLPFLLIISHADRAAALIQSPDSGFTDEMVRRIPPGLDEAAEQAQRKTFQCAVSLRILVKRRSQRTVSSPLQAKILAICGRTRLNQ